MRFASLGIAETLQQHPQVRVVGAPVPIEEEIAGFGPGRRVKSATNDGKSSAYMARTGCLTTLKIT